jgi:hypothetical protein
MRNSGPSLIQSSSLDAGYFYPDSVIYSGNFLLMEDGFYLLLEDGGRIELE